MAAIVDAKAFGFVHSCGAVTARIPRRFQKVITDVATNFSSYSCVPIHMTLGIVEYRIGLHDSIANDVEKSGQVVIDISIPPVLGVEDFGVIGRQEGAEIPIVSVFELYIGIGHMARITGELVLLGDRWCDPDPGVCF